MTRVLTGIGARSIVVLWAMALAALVMPALQPTERAAIRPVTPAPSPEAPGPEASLQEPGPETPDPFAAVPTAVTALDRAAGEQLLASGEFPPLHTRYEELGSFRAYADAMRNLGARFVVVERRRIRGEIDLAGGAIREGMPGGAYSPRARDYSGEPALARAAARARDAFGGGAAVMMLVPRSVDAALFGAVAGWLETRGEQPADYRALDARYARGPQGALRLHVDAGTRMDGSRTAIDLVVELAPAAGEGA